MTFAFERPFVARLAPRRRSAFAVALAPGGRRPRTAGSAAFSSQLFGGAAGETARAGPARKPNKKVRDFVPATTTREPGTPGGAPVQPTFFIDVLGDSLASLAADGLTEAFADKPEIAIADKSREASGLVRDDYYDWPQGRARSRDGQGPYRLRRRHGRHQ